MVGRFERRIKSQLSRLSPMNHETEATAVAKVAERMWGDEAVRILEIALAVLRAKRELDPGEPYMVSLVRVPDVLEPVRGRRSRGGKNEL